MPLLPPPPLALSWRTRSATGFSIQVSDRVRHMPVNPSAGEKPTSP
jgi:hypothetical protein